MCRAADTVVFDSCRRGLMMGSYLMLYDVKKRLGMGRYKGSIRPPPSCLQFCKGRMLGRRKLCDRGRFFLFLGPQFFSVSSLLCIAAVINLVQRPRQHGERMSHIMGIVEIHISIPLICRRPHTQAKVIPPGAVVADCRHFTVKI